MITVNLDPNFTPYGVGISINTFLFPSKCEVHVKLLQNISNSGEVLITTRIKSSDDIMFLLVATDAIREACIDNDEPVNISLVMPFVPYARQDAIVDYGESLTLKVFANLINTQYYKGVYIFDPHSGISPALINNSKPITNHAFIKSVLDNHITGDYFIVSPDNGAYKKMYKLCRDINYTNELLIGIKERNMATGEITKTAVASDDLTDKTCIIIDDIIDGGRTFIELGKALKQKGASKVILIASFGIFSKGHDVLREGIDKIYVSDGFNTIRQSDFVTQIKLDNSHLNLRF